MPGVVLAGGRGARLGPLSSYKPKPFIKLAGSPLYRYSLDELSAAGAEPRLLLTRAEWLGLVEDRVSVITQKGEGLDAALASVLDYAADEGFESLLIVFAGFLSSPRGMTAALADYYVSSEYPVALAVTPVATGLETYGFVDMDPSGPVRRVEDPFDVKKGGSRPGYVFAGVMAVSVKTFRQYMPPGGSFVSALNRMASEGLVGALAWSGEWVEIGYPWDILYAKDVALTLSQPTVSPEASTASSARLKGRVTVAAGARLGENTVVEGPAYIGRGARVSHNSVVIDSIVEDGAVIHPGAVVVSSVVMEGAVVGPNSYIERSIVGPRAVVGACSVFEAGKPARLPERLRSVVEDSLRPVKLGAIVAPGTRVPPGTTASGGEEIA